MMSSKTTLLCAGLLAAAAMNSPAADFIVINTNNSGAGSLRQAIPARSENGVERVVDVQPSPYRFYRLATPNQQ